MDRLKYHQERLDAKLGFKRDENFRYDFEPIVPENTLDVPENEGIVPKNQQKNTQYHLGFQTGATFDVDESYKESMKYYSQGWDEMKLFNRYKLANFRPKKNVLEVKAWLDSAQANYEKAKQVMIGVSNPPETISKAVGNLNRYIDELHTLIDQQWAAFNEHYKKELKKLKK